MNTFFKIALVTLSTAAVPAMAHDAMPITPVPAGQVAGTNTLSMNSLALAKGKMLLAADGARLAPIYRVGDNGAQIIIDGRLVTVPASTIGLVDGKVTTTLTKSQVIGLH